MKFLFTSARLGFREFTLADAPLIYQLNSDPEVIKYVHEPQTTLESAKDVIDNIIIPQYIKNKYGRWALHLQSSGEFMGWCGLKLVEGKGVDLGYRLMKKYWKQGYAKEAALATLSYGFNQLQIPLILGIAHEDNEASWRILEKCKMQYKGNDVVDDCPVKIYQKTKPVRM